MFGAAALLLGAAGTDSRLLSGSAFSVVAPAGWHARISVAGGSQVLTAASPGAPYVVRPRAKSWPGPLRPRDAALRLAEVGNRPGTAGFRIVREPPRLSASDLRPDGRLGGHPSAFVRFALRGRSLALVAVFGADPPAARALRETNALLRSLRVRSGRVDATTRTRVRRPLRRLEHGICRPAPDAHVAAAVALPVGYAPAYVGLGGPGATAVLGGDLRRGSAYLHKTLWAFAPSYRGPLLVRSLGRRGRVRVGDGRMLEWWLPASNRRRWRYAPSTTALPGPGCYAFQVDGTDFSVSIVFRARL